MITGSATATSGFSEILTALASVVRGDPDVRHDSNEAMVDRISSRTEFVAGLKLMLDMAVFRDFRMILILESGDNCWKLFESNSRLRGADPAQSD